MGDATENLKQIAQIRKAVMPLIQLLKNESDKTLEKRLDGIEAALSTLLKKDPAINVSPPEVNVKVDTAEITKSIEKMSKTGTTSTYEPHDQAKSGPYNYSGFVKSDGKWYIQRVAKGEQRYAKGTGEYTEAWDKRKNIKYGYIDA
jgi:hypothetical protein